MLTTSGYSTGSPEAWKCSVRRIAVVCLVVATSLALGVVPAAADGSPSLTVDPSTGLSGGAVVHRRHQGCRREPM